jgi:hypothetical protein
VKLGFSLQSLPRPFSCFLEHSAFGCGHALAELWGPLLIECQPESHGPPSVPSSFAAYRLKSLKFGHFINPSIHRGVLPPGQSVNRFQRFPGSLQTRHNVAAFPNCSSLKNR